MGRWVHHPKGAVFLAVMESGHLKGSKDRGPTSEHQWTVVAPLAWLEGMDKAAHMKLRISMILGVAAFLHVGTALGEKEAFEKDRRAILAMAGKFDVEFNFRETVSLLQDYELRKPYTADALEIVKVVEDTGARIVLQHILLADDGLDSRVVKHWGQIWEYEDSIILEFQGDRTWKKRSLESSSVKGTWTQLVTQVDDSPRYESWGKWVHEGNRSAWQSQDTNRPLPRREYTKRSDYSILRAINRHVITPEGWVHEQENRKWVKSENRFICHEAGLNIYRRCEEDFSLAEKEWNATQEFWRNVRSEWARLMEEKNIIAYKKEVGGNSLVRSTFSLARKVKKGEVLAEKEVPDLIRSFMDS